jgi:hypothetical protein
MSTVTRSLDSIHNRPILKTDTSSQSIQISALGRLRNCVHAILTDWSPCKNEVCTKLSYFKIQFEPFLYPADSTTHAHMDMDLKKILIQRLNRNMASSNSLTLLLLDIMDFIHNPSPLQML